MAKLPLHFRFFRAAVVYLLFGGFLGLLFSFETVHHYTHGTTIVYGHIVLNFFGWVTMTIMGAMGKMVPTMLSRDLHSENLGEIAYWFTNIGIIGYSGWLIFEGLVSGIYKFALPWFYSYISYIFASFILVGCFAFAYNLYKTMGLKTEKPIEPSIGLTLNFYRASITYLALSLIIAVLAILGFASNFLAPLPLRFANVLWVAPFTTLGWMTLTIMGAMYHLIPMFTISKIHNMNLARFQFWSLNIGIVLTGAASLLGYSRILDFDALAKLTTAQLIGGLVQTVGVVFAVLGVFLFLYNMSMVVRIRRRKELNISMMFYVAALLYFGLTGVFGAFLKSKPVYEFVEGTSVVLGHGLLSVIGFVSLTIMGSMYSILPMLAVVELHAKAKKVPTVLTEMYNERLAHFSFWFSTIGVAGYIAGLVGDGYLTATATESAVFPYKLLTYVSVIVLMVGVLLFANNMRKILGWLKD